MFGDTANAVDTMKSEPAINDNIIEICERLEFCDLCTYLYRLSWNGEKTDDTSEKWEAGEKLVGIYWYIETSSSYRKKRKIY